MASTCGAYSDNDYVDISFSQNAENVFALSGSLNQCQSNLPIVAKDPIKKTDDKNSGWCKVEEALLRKVVFTLMNEAVSTNNHIIDWYEVAKLLNKAKVDTAKILTQRGIKTKNDENQQCANNCSRLPAACEKYWASEMLSKSVRGIWTKSEDNLLRTLVKKWGAKRWGKLARWICGRKGKQCRERWMSRLDPSLNHGAWSMEEMEILKEARQLHHDSWSKIAKSLPGRSDTMVKNVVNAMKRQELAHSRKLKKQLKKKKKTTNVNGTKWTKIKETKNPNILEIKQKIRFDRERQERQISQENTSEMELFKRQVSQENTSEMELFNLVQNTVPSMNFNDVDSNNIVHRTNSPVCSPNTNIHRKSHGFLENGNFNDYDMHSDITGLLGILNTPGAGKQNFHSPALMHDKYSMNRQFSTAPRDLNLNSGLPPMYHPHTNNINHIHEQTQRRCNNLQAYENSRINNANMSYPDSSYWSSQYCSPAQQLNMIHGTNLQGRNLHVANLRGTNLNGSTRVNPKRPADRILVPENAESNAGFSGISSLNTPNPTRNAIGVSCPSTLSKFDHAVLNSGNLIDTDLGNENSIGIQSIQKPNSINHQMSSKRRLLSKKSLSKDLSTLNVSPFRNVQDRQRSVHMTPEQHNCFSKSQRVNAAAENSGKRLVRSRAPLGCGVGLDRRPPQECSLNNDTQQYFDRIGDSTENLSFSLDDVDPIGSTAFGRLDTEHLLLGDSEDEEVSKYFDSTAVPSSAIDLCDSSIGYNPGFTPTICAEPERQLEHINQLDKHTNVSQYGVKRDPCSILLEKQPSEQGLTPQGKRRRKEIVRNLNENSSNLTRLETSFNIGVKTHTNPSPPLTNISNR